MTAMHPSTEPPFTFDCAPRPARLPLWVNVLGLASVLGSVALAARLVWEQTVWTWDRGPQPVGASLAHDGGFVLYAFPVLLLGWLMVVAFVTVHDWARTRRFAWRRAAAAAAAIAIIAVLQLPYGFWQRTFVDRLSPERANELFVFAARAGDLETLKALRARGLAVDARAAASALSGAAASGRDDVVEFLLRNGAAPGAGRDVGGRPSDRP
jgi:hypothetical protein